MKRITKFCLAVAVLLTGFSFGSAAQNLQYHYDLGRGHATTTAEMFRPDNVGSTFFFIDLDYGPKMTGAYWEISRELNFWQDSKVNWLSVHVEYNGGLSGAFSFNNCWLGGLTYSGHSKDWSKTWSVSAMYKAIPGAMTPKGVKQPHNFQLTGVWNLDFFNHWISFNGFADFWREGVCIFLSEPQLWVNLKNIKGWEKVNLSVGTEVEISYNFIPGKKFACMPTIGAKYSF